MRDAGFYFLCLIFFCEVYSQQDTLVDRRFELPPIVVKATRTDQPLERIPYNVSIIGPQELNRHSKNLSIEEVIRSIPGVFINDRANPSFGDRVTIRGIGSRAAFGVRGVRIYLDNIPLTMPDGQSQLNNIDISSLGKIEIIKGGMSSLYGNSSGGVINLFSQDIQNRLFTVEPEYTAGAFGLKKIQGKVSGSIGTHSYLININHTIFDGYRQHANGNFTNLNFLGAHRVSSKIRLTTLMNYYNAPYLLSPGTISKNELENNHTSSRFFNIQQASGKKITQGQSGLTFSLEGEQSSLEVTGYFITRTLLNPIPGRIIDLSRTAYGLRSVYRTFVEFDNHSLHFALGFDYERMADARKEYQNKGVPASMIPALKPEQFFRVLQYGSIQLNQEESVTGFGPFSELQFTLNRAVTLTAGIRYDNTKFGVEDNLLVPGINYSGKKLFEQFSPMGGIAYRPTRHLKIYGNYSSNFQTPTTTELSNRPTGQRGFNPDIKPEESHNLEIGLVGSLPKLRLIYEVSLFRIDTRDMLVPYQVTAIGSEEIFYRNAARAENTGIEGRLEYYLIDNLRLTSAITLQNFKFKDYLRETEIPGDSIILVDVKGKYVPGIPKINIFVSAAYLVSDGVFAELSLRYIGEYFTNDLNGPAPEINEPLSNYLNDSYLKIDIKGGYSFYLNNNILYIYSGINNLLDKKYSGSIVPNAIGNRFFEAAAGRDWYAGIRLQFSAN